jgi:hypothetical protein
MPASTHMGVGWDCDLFFIILTKIRIRRHISVEVLSSRIHEIPAVVLELLRWPDTRHENNSCNSTPFRCERNKAQGKMLYFSVLSSKISK